MVFDCPSICSTKLSLGLGYYNNNTDRNVHIPQNHHHILDHGLGDDEDRDQKIKIKPRAASSAKSDLSSFPSLTLALQPSSEETLNLVVMDDTKGMTSDHHHSSTGQQGSSGSAVSSFSNSSSLKREIREVSGDNQEVFEEERISEKINGDGDQDEEGPRKKLRLTKEQSIILEDSFKVHSTLNPKQKQALANKLNLRPRQVEVWFQNRRARTKLKQTEVDFEILKKCCETLKEENKRLHKELQDLRVMKMVPPPPFYMQLPAATQTMCPSCETITKSGGDGGAAGEKSSKISLSIGAKPHFYSPFTNHPSAAC